MIQIYHLSIVDWVGLFGWVKVILVLVGWISYKLVESVKLVEIMVMMVATSEALQT